MFLLFQHVSDRTKFYLWNPQVRQVIFMSYWPSEEFWSIYLPIMPQQTNCSSSNFKITQLTSWPISWTKRSVHPKKNLNGLIFVATDRETKFELEFLGPPKKRLFLSSTVSNLFSQMITLLASLKNLEWETLPQVLRTEIETEFWLSSLHAFPLHPREHCERLNQYHRFLRRDTICQRTRTPKAKCQSGLRKCPVSGWDCCVNRLKITPKYTIDVKEVAKKL